MSKEDCNEKSPPSRKRPGPVELMKDSGMDPTRNGKKGNVLKSSATLRFVFKGFEHSEENGLITWDSLNLSKRGGG